MVAQNADSIYNRKTEKLYLQSCLTSAIFLVGLSDTYLHASMQYLVQWFFKLVSEDLHRDARVRLPSVFLHKKNVLTAFVFSSRVPLSKFLHFVYFLYWFSKMAIIISQSCCSCHTCVNSSLPNF